MPPKRKRTEDTPVTTRTTRSATHGSSASGANPPAAKKQVSKKNTKSDKTETSGPSARQARSKSLSKATSSLAGRGKNSQEAASTACLPKKDADKGGSPIDDDILTQSKDGRTRQLSATSLTAPLHVAKRAKTHPSLDNQTYTPKGSALLFAQYVDSDDPSVIGPEGFGDLCADADVPLDGALPLILAWQLGTKELWKITAMEWKQGTESLKIASTQSLSRVVHDLESLILLDRPAPDGKQVESYDRTAFSKYATDPKGTFKIFYISCFTLVKPEHSRNIEMETATALWSVLLTPKYPLMSEVITFINERPTTYKAANKDLWAMMLEFCEAVNPNLSDYEGDGAWPTLLDDFVSWKKGDAADQE